MDISFYYQLLDTGILYEKGNKNGKRWRIGERRRLNEEIYFWQSLLEFISDEENGVDCSEKVFGNLERLCRRYSFPNYERVLKKKQELINGHCTYERKKDEELKIRNLTKRLMADMEKNLNDFKDKEMVYRILTVLHHLPKALHGRNILNESCNLVSYSDALLYAQGCMDEKMKEDYAVYFDSCKQ